jgi:hypothetical protein
MDQISQSAPTIVFNALYERRGIELIPECVECGALWLPADAEHCKAHWIDAWLGTT